MIAGSERRKYSFRHLCVDERAVIPFRLLVQLVVHFGAATPRSSQSAPATFPQVGEAEMRRAQKYARTPRYRVHGDSAVHTVRSSGKQEEQSRLLTCTPIVANFRSATGQPTAQTERQRSCASPGEDIVATATALTRTATGDHVGDGTASGTSQEKKLRIYPPGHPANNRLRYNRLVKREDGHPAKLGVSDGIGVGAASGLVSSDSEGSTDSGSDEGCAVDTVDREAGPTLRNVIMVGGRFRRSTTGKSRYFAFVCFLCPSTLRWELRGRPHLSAHVPYTHHLKGHGMTRFLRAIRAYRGQ